MRSMISRAGAFTSATDTGPAPGGHPVAGGGGGVAGRRITGVGAEAAEVTPSALRAKTRARSVLPASTSRSVYVREVAPPIAAQLLPSSAQRLHWYVKLVGLPVHVPVLVVSVLPTSGVPEIVGRA